MEMIAYWESVLKPWFHGGLPMGGGLIGIACLVWPAAAAYSVQFWLTVKKHEQGKKIFFLLAGILLLLSCFLWHMPNLPWIQPWCIPTASILVFWIVGCIVYELPRLMFKKS